MQSSGDAVLRVSVSLRPAVEERLRLRAARERVSMSALAARLIEEALNGSGRGPGATGSGGDSGLEAAAGREPSGSARADAGVAAPVSSRPAKLYARAGCPEKVAEGVRCETCKAVHKP